MVVNRLKNYFRRSDDNLPRVVAFMVLAISGVPLLVVAMYRDAHDPETLSNQGQLEREFRALTPVPKSMQLSYESSQKSGLANVTATYEISLEGQEPLSYYDAELANKGWLLYEGEQSARHYCKGRYKASLECFSKSHCVINLTWGYESFVERYFTGSKYRSHGCSD